MNECDQENCIVSDTFRIITPCSTTYHLEVGAPVSLKLATKASFGGKKYLKIEIFRIFLKSEKEGVQPKKNFV